MGGYLIVLDFEYDFSWGSWISVLYGCKLGIKVIEITVWNVRNSL